MDPGMIKMGMVMALFEGEEKEENEEKKEKEEKEQKELKKRKKVDLGEVHVGLLCAAFCYWWDIL